MLEVAAEYHIEAEAIGGSEFPEVEARRARGAVPQVLPAADVGCQLPSPAQERPRPVRVPRTMTGAAACDGLSRRRLQPGDGGPDGHDDPRRPRRRRREDRAAARRLRARRARLSHVEPRQALGGARPDARVPTVPRPLALAQSADVVLESFRPGVAERLGIGYEAVVAANPRVVYCSITGFGRDDPRSQRRTYEVDVAATAGRMVGLDLLSGAIPNQDRDAPLYTAAPIASYGAGATGAARHPRRVARAPAHRRGAAGRHQPASPAKPRSSCARTWAAAGPTARVSPRHRAPCTAGS